MSYSAIEKGKKFISDQPYLYYYTGTPDNVIEHYAYLKPIDAKALNGDPDNYSGGYFFKELELGDRAISSTYSMVKNVPTAYQRLVYEGAFEYDKKGNLLGGTIESFSLGTAETLQKWTWIDEGLYPNQKPIAFRRIEELEDNEQLSNYKTSISSPNPDFFPNGLDWVKKPWGANIIVDSKKVSGNPETDGSDKITSINQPSKFNKKSADKITNFNPSTDTLEIDTDSFGIDSSATFASGKNKKAVKKKLAKQDFDFLYDEKKGGLYFNENGANKGFGDGGIIAILKGVPDLTSDNLEFI